MSEIDHKSLVQLYALVNAKLDASTHQLNAIRHERDSAIALAESFANRIETEKLPNVDQPVPFDYLGFSAYRAYLTYKKRHETQKAEALNGALRDRMTAVKKDLSSCVAIDLLKKNSETRHMKKLLDVDESERERLTSLSVLKQRRK